MIKTKIWTLSCSLLLCTAAAVFADEPNKSPTAEVASATAADSVNHIQIPAGTELELIASEPQAIDPIAIRFDEFGRMWVTSNQFQFSTSRDLNMVYRIRSSRRSNFGCR
jgi:hypothetical protein